MGGRTHAWTSWELAFTLLDKLVSSKLLCVSVLGISIPAPRNGWVADSAVSFVVGNDPDPEDLRIIKCTEAAAHQAYQEG